MASTSGRTRLLIIAGGPSEVHDASIMSGRAVFDAVSNNPKLRVSILVITRDGGWLSEADSKEAIMAGAATRGGEARPPAPLSELFDVVFSLIDGWAGGGGAIQGLLEMERIPYIGCGPLASALSRDKQMAKEVLSRHGIPMVHHFAFTSDAYIENPESMMQQVLGLKAPWFVKPANLGSSVGVSKVKEQALLSKAIEEAMKYDRRIIIEEGVSNARELEVAILGNIHPRVSPVGEITYEGEIYDWESKYRAGKAQFHIPANIPGTIAKKLQAIALQAYHVLDCAGFARVDFFLDPQTENLYFNELTSSPSLTYYSIFPKLMQAEGYEMCGLIEALMKLAFERHTPRTEMQVAGGRES